eukprot:ctg_433.g269
MNVPEVGEAISSTALPSASGGTAAPHETPPSTAARLTRVFGAPVSRLASDTAFTLRDSKCAVAHQGPFFSRLPLMGALTYVSVVVSGLLWRDRGIALSSVHHSLSSLTCSSLFQAGLVLLAFITLLAVAGSALPGWVHPGTLLPDGKTRLYYKCNGLLLLVLSVVAWLLGDRYFGHEVGAWAAHHCGALFLAAQATAFTLATYLVVRARWLDQLRRRNWFRNRESSWLHDFILGAELNPHLLGGRLELKFFWLRPSMIGWCLLNLSIAAQQLAVHGRLSPRMLLYQVLADGYIVDYFWNEKRMTTTWDIVAEHFGLMLIWGDLVFIRSRSVCRRGVCCTTSGRCRHGTPPAYSEWPRWADICSARPTPRRTRSNAIRSGRSHAPGGGGDGHRATAPLARDAFWPAAGGVWRDT